MTNFTPESNPNVPEAITLLSILKAFNSATNREFPTRLTNVNDLLSDTIRPLFDHIRGDPYSNEELGAILTELTKQIMLNTREIVYLHHLIALITFDLDKQGIELDDKELQQNLQTYLKFK